MRRRSVHFSLSVKYAPFKTRADRYWPLGCRCEDVDVDVVVVVCRLLPVYSEAPDWLASSTGTPGSRRGGGCTDNSS